MQARVKQVARFITHLVIVLTAPSLVCAEDVVTLSGKSDGYRGIWYMNSPLKSEYRFKYSGGLATYCAKHKPFAIYRPEVDKTFFCYGGAPEGYHRRDDLKAQNLDRAETTGALHHLVSFYDHRTGKLPRPTILLDKRTHDAHDNPVISMDDRGHIWIFSTAHGDMRPAFVHRSDKPYDIDSFSRVDPQRLVGGKKVPITNFSYMQAWHVPHQGFVYFFTKYEKWNREMCFATSLDGVLWTNWTRLADFEEGHYQISAAKPGKAACSFNYHPTAFGGDASKKGLNWRTNLYYMETVDAGKTWRTAEGERLDLPLKQSANPALIHDYEKEGLLVYLKDIVFDTQNRPIILFVTARSYHSGPSGGPRTWRIARWSGKQWMLHDITTSDSNYDMGSLYVEKGVLKVIAPTDPGPQAYNPGGEVAIWTSHDEGGTWKRMAQLTQGSETNHSYVRRPVDAHPGFYAMWADGHGREPSPSRLYFCNRDGEVFMMPTEIDGDQADPLRVHPMGSESR